MKIDTRFLTLHPATAAWFAQRETCRRCAWLIDIVGTRELDSMRCRKAPQATICQDPRRATRRYYFCIDARLPDGPCGPDAALFKPREG